MKKKMTMYDLRNDHSDIDRARDHLYGNHIDEDDFKAFQEDYNRSGHRIPTAGDTLKYDSSGTK